MLSKQRYFNDKYEFRYSKFDKSSTSKTIFVKDNNKFNNLESRKVQIVIHPKKTYVKNNVYHSNKLFNASTCFYCKTRVIP